LFDTVCMKDVRYQISSTLWHQNFPCVFIQEDYFRVSKRLPNVIYQ